MKTAELPQPHEPGWGTVTEPRAACSPHVHKAAAAPMPDIEENNDRRDAAQCAMEARSSRRSDRYVHVDVAGNHGNGDGGKRASCGGGFSFSTKRPSDKSSTVIANVRNGGRVFAGRFSTAKGFQQHTNTRQHPCHQFQLAVFCTPSMHWCLALGMQACRFRSAPVRGLLGCRISYTGAVQPHLDSGPRRLFWRFGSTPCAGKFVRATRLAARSLGVWLSVNRHADGPICCCGDHRCVIRNETLMGSLIIRARC
eukprot:351557-Chlamydomonas_euryale.AAC.27